MGLSFISRHAVADALAARWLAAATGPAARVPRQIHFLSLKGARLSPAALAFLALARKGAPDARPEGGEVPWRTGASRSA